MPIGPVVRRAFGRHERKIAEMYRSIFVDLDDWVKMVREWAPAPQRILELGCGEGYSTERLVAAFPDAEIDAIDIAYNIGRLYAGPPERVRFRVAFAENLAQENPHGYDLVILSDVLHHVPETARKSLLAAARTLTAEGGVFLFKDWHRNAHPIYFVAYAADRWIGGDRIAYLTREEARDLITPHFGACSIVAERTVAPWRNNYAMCVRP